MRTTEQRVSDIFSILNDHKKSKLEDLRKEVVKLYTSYSLSFDEKYQILSAKDATGKTIFISLFQTNDNQIIRACFGMIFSFINADKVVLGKSLLDGSKIQKRFIKLFRIYEGIPDNSPEAIKVLQQISYGSKIVAILANQLCSIDHVSKFAGDKEAIVAYIFSLPENQRLTIINDIFSEQSLLHHVFHLQRGRFKPNTSRGTLGKLMQEKKRIESLPQKNNAANVWQEFDAIEADVGHGELNTVHFLQTLINIPSEDIKKALLNWENRRERFFTLLCQIHIKNEDELVLLQEFINKKTKPYMFNQLFEEDSSRLGNWIVAEYKKHADTYNAMSDGLMAIATYFSNYFPTPYYDFLCAEFASTQDQLLFLKHRFIYAFYAANGYFSPPNSLEELLNEFDSIINNAGNLPAKNECILLDTFLYNQPFTIINSDSASIAKGSTSTSIFKLLKHTNNVNSQKRIFSLLADLLLLSLKRFPHARDAMSDHHYSRQRKSIIIIIARMLETAYGDALLSSRVFETLRNILAATNYSRIASDIIGTTLNNFNIQSKFALRFWHDLFKTQSNCYAYLSLVEKCDLSPNKKRDLLSPRIIGTALTFSQEEPKVISAYFDKLIEVFRDMELSFIRGELTCVVHAPYDRDVNFIGALLTVSTDVTEVFDILLSHLTVLLKRKTLTPASVIEILLRGRNCNPYFNSYITRGLCLNPALHPMFNRFLSSELMSTVSPDDMEKLVSSQIVFRIPESQPLLFTILNKLDAIRSTRVILGPRFSLAESNQLLEASLRKELPTLNLRTDTYEKLSKKACKAINKNANQCADAIKMLSLLAQAKINARSLVEIIREQNFYKNIDGYYSLYRAFIKYQFKAEYSLFLQEVVRNYQNDTDVARIPGFDDLDDEHKLICVFNNCLPNDDYPKWASRRNRFAQIIKNMPEAECVDYITQALDPKTSLGKLFWTKPKGFLTNTITINDAVIQSLIEAKGQINNNQPHFFTQTRLQENANPEAARDENPTLIGNAQL